MFGAGRNSGHGWPAGAGGRRGHDSIAISEPIAGSDAGGANAGADAGAIGSAAGLATRAAN